MPEHPTPTYVDLMTAIDALMLAHSEEVRGGRTEELRAETSRRYAEVAHLVRAATIQPAPPPAPEDDPRLPKRRPPRPR
ncbi:MAG: hypothetical protein HOV78_11545 [Hamadaea sp.]|nr:hypothetical protein [Hamadaea sp.]